jgi:hypothetical protein
MPSQMVGAFEWDYTAYPNSSRPGPYCVGHVKRHEVWQYLGAWVCVSHPERMPSYEASAGGRHRVSPLTTDVDWPSQQHRAQRELMLQAEREWAAAHPVPAL